MVQLDAIIVPQPTSRDINSASHKLAKQMYGDNLENYSDTQYSVDVLKIYNQKAVILRDITSLMKELDTETQQALNNEIRIFDKLAPCRPVGGTNQ